MQSILCALLLAAPNQERLITVRSTGWETHLEHPKDAGLRDALRLLRPRLVDLQEEVPDLQELPPDFLPFLLRLASGPVTVDVRQSSEGPLPVTGRFQFPGATPGETEATLRGFGALWEMMGLPPARVEDGLHATDEVPFPVWFARTEGGVEAGIGADPSLRGTPTAGARSLPAGASSLISIDVDFGGLMGVLSTAMEMSGEASPGDVAEVRGMLDSLGLSGLHMGWDAFRTEQGLVSRAVLGGGPDMLATMGLEGASGLDPLALAAIPRDASWFSCGHLNGSAILDNALKQLTRSMEQAGTEGDPLGMLAEATGIDLRGDLIANLGSAWGMYASDTTGGGGLSSAVLFCTTRGEGLAGFVEKVEAMMDEVSRADLDGRMQMRPWEADGVRYRTLVFAGLPVPLEPTMATAGEVTFFALSPQAALGAAHQLLRASTNITHSEAFRARFDGELGDVVAISYFDTARYLRSGYAPMMLMGAALANATRSPGDPGREAGMVIPPYHALARGVEPSVTVTRLAEGGRIVETGRTDGSVVVNLTAALGFLADGPLMPLLSLMGAAAQDGTASPRLEYRLEESYRGEEEHEHHEHGDR